MRPPLLSFDGFEPRTEEDLEARVEALLQGRRRSPSPHDTYAYQWVVRLWHAANADLRGVVAGTVGRELCSPDVRCRSQAVRFFQSCEADDRGALLGSLHYHLDLFEGVTDPIPGATGDLRGEVLRAVAREPGRSRDAIELLRGEVLAPGRAGPVLVGLMQIDLAWVRANAIAIVSSNRESYVTLVVNYALLELDLVELVVGVRDVVPREWAREVLRERLATRGDLMDRCLEVLSDAHIT